MKKIICILAFAIAFLGVSAQNKIIGSKEISTKEMKMKPFSSIRNNSICDVEITQSTQNKVVITANDNVIDKIHVEVKNNELRISNDKGSYSKCKMKISIFTPKLDEIALSGTGNTVLNKFQGENLFISNSGTGDFTAKNVVKINKDIIITNSGTGDITFSALSGCKSLTINNSGTGDIDISSAKENDKIGEIIWNCSGTGDITAKNIYAENASFVMPGTGDINISGKTEKLTVKNSGTGDLSAAKFIVNTAHVSNTGIGDVKVFVNKEAFLSSSNIFAQTSIYGKAKIIKN